MKYAVVKLGIDQFLVKEGKKISLKKTKGEEGEKIKLGEALLLVSDQEVKVGKPSLDKVEVWGKIEKQEKGQKKEVYKYRSKSRYRKKMGYRVPETIVRVEKIKVLN